MSNKWAVKNFYVVTISFSVPYNYFDLVQQNHFSDLYSVKILDLSAKPFFPKRKLSYKIILYFYGYMFVCESKYLIHYNE